jgi:hypothetical protein
LYAISQLAPVDVFELHHLLNVLIDLELVFILRCSWLLLVLYSHALVIPWDKANEFQPFPERFNVVNNLLFLLFDKVKNENQVAAVE